MAEIRNQARIVRVAAVQIASQHGLIVANHARATPFVEQAAQAGAQLVVLPETFASGYVPNAALWDAAEPPEGPTVTWLRKTARRLGIHLGAGLVQTDGKDFYNDYVVCTPEGEVAGCARKVNAESYCFRRGPGVHVIQTALGKLGVGICADNQFAALLQRMQDESVDLMLMPHAWPTPYRAGGRVTEQDMQEQRAKTEQLPLLYANCLGVPAIFVNLVGAMGSVTGLLGMFMTPATFRLEGRSRIVDSDGAIRAAMDAEEGIIVADVTLDPARKRSIVPASYDGWLLPGAAVSRKVIVPLDVRLGQIYYALSARRRRKAQEIYRSRTL